MTRIESRVVFTARHTAELQQMEPNPLPLGPREVSGHTLVSLVSTGTELEWGYRGETFPSYPGYAAVFQIDEVGAEVTGIAPGSVALCLGSHASSQRVAVDDAVIAPDGLTPEVAAFARIACISMSTLTTTTARPPGPVLVTGLGLVGNLAAQVFASAAYEVWGYDPSVARRAALEGAPGVRALTEGPLDPAGPVGRYALALECAGLEEPALACCKAVRPRGEVVLIGVPWRKRSDLPAHDLLHAVFHKYAVLRSGWEWEVPLKEQPFRTNSIYGNIATAMRWLQEGRLRVDDLFEARPAAECSAVYQALSEARWPKPAAIFDWR
jgi:threonine dehydrogenase-like Zn-dependent dehydrogenase